MKMFKKLMAVAIVGVMALAVLSPMPSLRTRLRKLWRMLARL